jgi:hypothetical protein
MMFFGNDAPLKITNTRTMESIGSICWLIDSSLYELKISIHFVFKASSMSSSVIAINKSIILKYKK